MNLMKNNKVCCIETKNECYSTYDRSVDKKARGKKKHHKTKNLI